MKQQWMEMGKKDRKDKSVFMLKDKYVCMREEVVDELLSLRLAS